MKKELIQYFDAINTTIKTFNKDDIIVKEGDTSKYIYYIIDGNVKAYTYSSEDNIYVINEISEKDIFGEIPLYSSNEIYLGDVIATKKTNIKLISKSTLNNLFKDEHFVNLYMNYLSDKFLTLQNRLKVLSQKSIRDKLVFYISKRCKRLNTNTLIIKSKNELAEYLNIPRPSLSRELIKMREENLITFDRHSITKKWK